MHRRHFLQSTFAALASAQLNAQPSERWPERPIRLLSPMPLGGSPDATVREFAEYAGQSLGQRWLVENMASAGGLLMMRKLKAAAPDGYTLGVVTRSQMVIAPHLYKALDYSTTDDFTCIGTWTNGSQALYVRADSKATDWASLSSLLRAANPLAQGGTLGPSTPGGLLLELLREQTGLPVAPVAFRGNDIALALVRGDIPFSIAGVSDHLGLVQSGQIRPLMVFQRERFAFWPQVQSFTEAGLRDLDHPIWFGLIGPKGLSRAITEKIEATMQQAWSAPAYSRRRLDVGGQKDLQSGEKMRERVRDELATYGPLMRRAKVEWL